MSIHIRKISFIFVFIGLLFVPLAVTHAQVAPYGYGYGYGYSEYPSYSYSYPSPTCTLSITTPNTYTSNAVSSTLSWTSNNSTSAYISSIGPVNTWGSVTAYAYPYEVFTLTVTGPGGTGTCQTEYYPPQYSYQSYSSYYPANNYYVSTPSYSYYAQPVPVPVPVHTPRHWWQYL